MSKSVGLENIEDKSRKTSNVNFTTNALTSEIWIHTESKGEKE